MTAHQVAIVGAGLSGLALAAMLRAGGQEVVVLEARDRVGGRILSVDGMDLGPAWIWPHNRRMLALVARLGLRSFPQYSTGHLVFEDARGAIRRDLEMATMAGALRIEGGLAGVTEALARDLGGRLRLNHGVTRVTQEADAVLLTGPAGELRAERVVLALPPRLARGLGVPATDAPTWMAGQAKVVARYGAPFWRDAGLNGDAISHLGPLAEIHDASPADGAGGALFGFVMPGAAGGDLRARAVAQLARLFGPEAAAPEAVLIKDWSLDAETATGADRVPPPGHPTYAAQGPFGRVILAGTEVAPQEGGFLEGALEAAERAARQLLEGVA